MAFLCVDVGGTNTRIGVGNGEFDVIEKLRSKEFLEDISGAIEGALEKADYEPGEIENVAIAVAGPLDREKGVFYPPNIDMEEVQVMEPLEAFWDKIMIINDCTAAALGEYHYGGHDVEDMVYVTISSGIGSGAIIDRDVIDGWNGNAGEVGHIQITDRDLGKDNDNTWESMCSGNHLPILAENLTDREFDDAIQLFEAYENGDSDAERTIEEMKEMNARGFGTIINMFNPEKIVVGGSVALNQAETVVEPLEDDVEEKVVNPVPDIELCSLGDEVVIHGLRAACNNNYIHEYIQ